MEIQSDLYSHWRFYSLIFFSPEPLDYITISTRQILLIKVEANFLGLSSESLRGGAQGRKWFAKNTLNTEADLIHVWPCWSAAIWMGIIDFIIFSSFSFYNTTYRSVLIIPGKHVGILYETDSSLFFSNPCHWPAHFWKRQTKNGKERWVPIAHSEGKRLAQVGHSIGPPVPQS